MKQPFWLQKLLNAPVPASVIPDLCDTASVESLTRVHGMAGDLTGIMVVEIETVVFGFGARYSGQSWGNAR